MYTVLDKQLADGEYLAGDYSIADIATWPWVLLHGWAGVEIDDLPNLKRWLERVGERPAVQAGRAVPKPLDAPKSEDVEQSGARILI